MDVVVANAAPVGVRMLDVIDPYNLKRALERVNELRRLAAVSADVSFLRNARRATLPLPVIDHPQTVDADVFLPFRTRPVEALRDGVWR